MCRWTPRWSGRALIARAHAVEPRPQELQQHRQRDLCRRAAESDLTAKVLLENLPAGEDIFYRVSLQDLASPTIIAKRTSAAFVPRAAALVSFTCRAMPRAGLGYRCFSAACARSAPSATTIRTSSSIPATASMPTHDPPRDQAAERRDLAQSRYRGEVGGRADATQFRGNYKYNLARRQCRAFNAEVPILAQWTNTRSTNDWWPSRVSMRPATPIAAPVARRARRPRLPRIHADAAEPGRAGRVYRKIGYGPLLDVFMIDMRSYRGPTAGRERRHCSAPSRLPG